MLKQDKHISIDVAYGLRYVTITKVYFMEISSDYQNICCFDNLYRAYRKCGHGKSHKPTYIKFQNNCMEELLKLQSDLVNKTYKMKPYREFTVYEPKERLIKSNGFRDKIVQGALCRSYLNQEVGKHLILDNYASQQDKGTHFGLNRLSKFIHSYYMRYGCEGWILKGDISKYFYSIDHTILKQQLCRFIHDKDILWLLNLIIDSTDGVGIPIGNQISQVFAILYLNGIDHLIKDKLGIKYYGRYMDDFYIIHHDKKRLQEILKIIDREVKKLGLRLNNKTQIFPLRNGIDFLGFHTYLIDNGRVIRKLRKHSKENAKRKLKGMGRLYSEGKISAEAITKSYQSWRGHAKHGNTTRLLIKTDAYFESIMKQGSENNDDSNKLVSL